MEHGGSERTWTLAGSACVSSGEDSTRSRQFAGLNNGYKIDGMCPPDRRGARSWSQASRAQAVCAAQSVGTSLDARLWPNTFARKAIGLTSSESNMSHEVW